MHHSTLHSNIDTPARVPANDQRRFRLEHARRDASLREAPSRTQAPRPDGVGAGDVACDEDVCQRIRAHMCDAHGANRVRRYLNDRTRMTRLEDGTIELAAGDAFTLDMIERRLGDAIRIAAQFTLRVTEPKIRYRVDPSLQPCGQERQAGHTPEAERGAPVPGSGAPSHAGLANPMPRPPVPAAKRCPRLESFIVGASNRLAYESVRQCVESPSPGVPVFVHGPCGVGKTHLLRGATMLARTLRPGCKVRYTTGEAFTNAFVTAIRTRTIEAFQKKYRGLDLLCIDDIHLMAGKQATQHELLQIFNTLSLGGARILLASDAHPRTIARFDQALASRFSAGLVVRVDEPDRELSNRLIHELARKHGMSIDDACARVVCDRVGAGRGASVRDLEGAIVQIQAVARLLDRDAASGAGPITPSPACVRRALALRCGEDEPASSGPLSLEKIVRTVCAEMRVSIGDLRGKGRQKKVVLARELIIHLARQLTSKSFPEIAHELGRRNHSTVITAAKRFKQRLRDGQPVLADCPFDGLPLSELTQRLTHSVQHA